MCHLEQCNEISQSPLSLIRVLDHDFVLNIYAYLLSMVPKCKSSDAENLNLPKRICKVLSLSENMNVVNKEKKWNGLPMEYIRPMVRSVVYP